MNEAENLVTQLLQLAVNNPYIFVTIALGASIWWLVQKMISPLVVKIVDVAEKTADSLVEGMKSIRESIEKVVDKAVEKAVAMTTTQHEETRKELGRVDKKLNVIYRLIDKEKILEHEYESI